MSKSKKGAGAGSAAASGRSAERTSLSTFNPTRPKASKATRWRFAVLIGVHALIAIHIAHWLSTGKTVSPLEPSEAMEFAKNSVVNAGLIFFAITILSTLILGRWFCGWACHLVALQDMSRALLLKMGIRPRPLRSRWMALVPFAAAFYMFLWPLIYRVWIKDPITVAGVEFETENLWATFTTSWLWGGITFFVAGFLVIYFLGAKGFCTYACPYGAVFASVEKFSPGRIRVTDACVECGHCTLTCTSNVDVAREVHDYGMVVDKGCMKCMDCVSVCPEDALYFGFGKPAVLAKPRQKKRVAKKPLPLLEEVVALVSCAFAYFAWRGYRQERDFLLSLGVAVCFAFFCVTLVRLLRKKDVKWPGLTLKKGGSTTAVAQLMGVGTLVVIGLAIPFGLVPEAHAWKALAAEHELEEAKSVWFTPAQRPLEEEEREAAQALYESAKLIDRRSGTDAPHNTMRIVWASLLLGKDAELEASIERLIRDGTAGLEAMLVWANYNVAKGKETRDNERMKLAVEVFTGITERFPEKPGPANALASLFASGRDPARGLAVVDRALANVPEDHAHGLHYTRANILLQLGRLDEALADFETAVQKAAPEEREPIGALLMQVASSLAGSGETDLARGFAETALTADPGNEQAASLLGTLPQ